MVLTATAAAADDRRTPLGHAILDAAAARGLTLHAAASEIGVTRQMLSAYIWRPRIWPRPDTQGSLAAFLGASLDHVRQLLSTGGAKPRIPRLAVMCDHCDAPLEIKRWQARGRFRRRHHFCNKQHYHLWLTGRKRPPPLPRIGPRRGRHLLKVQRMEALPSDRAIAERLGVTEHTVRWARVGRHKPSPVTRYGLELEGVLPRRARAPLAELVLAFCVENRLTLPAFAQLAGLPYGTVWGLVDGSGRRARPKTLSALSGVLERKADDLRAIGGAYGWRRRSRSRRGRRPGLTPAQDQEVRRLRDMEHLSYAGIGLRMGLYVKPDGHCPVAERAYRRPS